MNALPWAMAAALLAAPAQAQNQTQTQEPAVVPSAPPEVRDFQLKPGGSEVPAPVRELPPAEVPRVQVLPPGLTTTSPVTQPTTNARPPVAVPAPARAPAARPEPAPRPRAASPVDQAAQTAVQAPPPTVEANPGATPLPAPVEPGPAASIPAPSTPDDRGFPWFYALLGGLALLAGLAVLTRRRAAAPQEEAPVIAEPEEAEAPAAAPEPAVAAAVPAADPEARPRIQLEFKPTMAGSTETEAAVQFELVVRNVGRSTARNLRIAIRMINAGPQQNDALAAFFQAPIEEEIHRPLTIPAGGVAETRRTAVLPKESVQAISFQGKSLFIPVVAFNALYDWGDGQQGQTATSFVVGRETDPPTEKMAPFRLDLGPRIYRSVGQRRNEPELVA